MSLPTSPFVLHPDDVAYLESCEEFQRLRQSLAKEDDDDDFCDEHCPATESQRRDVILHRDIVRILIAPVLRSHERAAQLAESRLKRSKSAELERAFKGEARGAFLWLQCFVSDEGEWCSTQGCPGCTVHYVLESESTVRIALVASRLSAHLPAASDPSVPLLDFEFWQRSMHDALDQDSFWGPGHWEDILHRALRLERGIQELMSQALALEDALRHSGGHSSSPLLSKFADVSCALSPPASLKICKSQMADHQLRLIEEEARWIRNLVVAWSSAFADPSSPSSPATSPGIMAPFRRRSLTAWT
ncbi:hypothetical protein L228DRAFT_280545 [Xylona heveae TC161]|uniref:Uncharacterized protein n=1 Tax=Xylona heveae (strain CBS 132557 / TC161) TaxID=1328760 RepID=A0A165IRU0_XYLHT|nr:hypothetical protein L228DRAFT_280545 [Xylona heveae TC161]KZF25293.1 hypothetical protein L228DRAFT_280545 [Xylona heveae TC161]